MPLDIPTLTFAGAVGAFASGVFLLMNWWEDRDSSPALWWGIANCGLGLGTALLAFHDSITLDLWRGLTWPILDACAVSTWVAARIFNRGSIEPVRVALTTVVWVALEEVVRAQIGESWAVMLGVTVSAGLYLAAAYEFWRTRREPLRGRWSMVTLLGLYAVELCLTSLEFRTVDGGMTRSAMQGWIGVTHLGSLIYALGSSTFLLTMLRDRSEQQHRTAALTDPLTGLPNRRAFEGLARRLVERSLRLGDPVSAIAFDLDRFKQINDTFGHSVGDEVLRTFGRTLSQFVRSVDAVGRMGGEEFVALLPGCDPQDALAVAGRVRLAFQNSGRTVGGHNVSATVSAGVAGLGVNGVTNLAQLIDEADRALYRSKCSGRNKVLFASDTASPEPSATADEPPLRLIA